MGDGLHDSDERFQKKLEEAKRDDLWHENVNGPAGWICPVCGRGLSPYTNFCPCKEWGEMIVTCGTTVKPHEVYSI